MAANRFSSVREEMEREISSRNEKQSSATGNSKQSSTTETLDSYMNQRAQSFQEQRNNGAARNSYTAQMDSRRSANDFVTRYNRFLDNVEESGYTPENVKAFDSLQAEYSGVSGLFNQGARKKFKDSFASIKDYFGGFAGRLSSIQYPEQIDYRREELQKSYQEALDEAIEANPGVSLHNLPVTDDMKFIRSEMDQLDEFEENFTKNKNHETASSPSEYPASFPDQMEGVESEKENNARSGSFRYDPNYDRSFTSILAERYSDYDPTITEPDDTELELATIKNGDGYTEIRFEEEPSREMMDALEDNGFTYRDANNTWYGRLSPEETRGIIRENSDQQAGDDGDSSDAASGTMEEIKEPTLKVGHDLDSNQTEEEIVDDSEMETTTEEPEKTVTLESLSEKYGP